MLAPTRDPGVATAGVLAFLGQSESLNSSDLDSRKQRIALCSESCGQPNRSRTVIWLSALAIWQRVLVLCSFGVIILYVPTGAMKMTREEERELYRDAIREALLNVRGLESELEMVREILSKRLQRIEAAVISDNPDLPVH